MAVKALGHDHDVETANISSGGVLFDIDDDLDIGSRIEFVISMPASVLGTPGDVTVNCSGRVMRSMREGQMSTVAAVIDEYRFERP